MGVDLTSCGVFYTEIDSWALPYVYVPHLVNVELPPEIECVNQTNLVLSTDPIKQ